jgi:hypothetical protein
VGAVDFGISYVKFVIIRIKISFTCAHAISCIMSCGMLNRSLRIGRRAEAFMCMIAVPV